MSKIRHGKPVLNNFGHSDAEDVQAESKIIEQANGESPLTAVRKPKIISAISVRSRAGQLLANHRKQTTKNNAQKIIKNHSCIYDRICMAMTIAKF